MLRHGTLVVWIMTLLLVNLSIVDAVNGEFTLSLICVATTVDKRKTNGSRAFVICLRQVSSPLALC